jgi:hypothetical protein
LRAGEQRANRRYDPASRDGADEIAMRGLRAPRRDARMNTQVFACRRRRCARVEERIASRWLEPATTTLMRRNPRTGFSFE